MQRVTVYATTLINSEALSCNPFINKSASEISNADFQLN